MTDYPKILFVLQALGTGGSERVVLDIARAIGKDGFNVSVLGITDGSLRKHFEDEGIEVFVGEKQPGLDTKLIARLSQIIRRVRPDIVNTHHFSPLFYSFIGCELSRTTRLVHTEHSRWEMDDLSWLWKGLIAQLLRRTDAIIGVSKETCAGFKDSLGIPDSKIHLIPNGLDIDRFDRSFDSGAKRRELGIADGERVIGCIGNLRPEKNQRVLIRAFSIVLKKFPQTRLVFAGRDLMNGSLKGLADGMGLGSKVLFLGARKDVPELYSVLDVFCLPSLYEGMPISILEAMASKVPIVATDVLGIRGIITSDETGLLVKSNDAQALADGIERLLVDSGLRGHTTRKAFEYVSNHHNMNAWINRYKEFFSSIYAK